MLRIIKGNEVVGSIDDPDDFDFFAGGQSADFKIHADDLAAYKKTTYNTKVNNESKRRIYTLLGVKDCQHAIIRQLNNAKLLAKLQAVVEPTGEQIQQCQNLLKLDENIEAILIAGRAIKDNPPGDYTDNKHWPAF